MHQHSRSSNSPTPSSNITGHHLTIDFHTLQTQTSINMPPICLDFAKAARLPNRNPIFQTPGPSQSSARKTQGQPQEIYFFTDIEKTDFALPEESKHVTRTNVFFLYLTPFLLEFKYEGKEVKEKFLRERVRNEWNANGWPVFGCVRSTTLLVCPTVLKNKNLLNHFRLRRFVPKPGCYGLTEMSDHPT